MDNISPVSWKAWAKDFRTVVLLPILIILIGQFIYDKWLKPKETKDPAKFVYHLKRVMCGTAKSGKGEPVTSFFMYGTIVNDGESPIHIHAFQLLIKFNGHWDTCFYLAITPNDRFVDTSGVTRNFTDADKKDLEKVENLYAHDSQSGYLLFATWDPYDEIVKKVNTIDGLAYRLILEDENQKYWEQNDYFVSLPNSLFPSSPKENIKSTP